ncbi:hypothetical protein HK096_001134 [Nowakowskiella sp. JEL0078]|nr:hypothetical protein HK096_001134 [Nowakowskiella sp. JEL0078]
MGGGAQYPYPKWVWSYYGGWWPNPKNYFRNSVITFSAIVALNFILAAGVSTRKETRIRYPERWIPSMLWSRDFHDPAFKAQWQEQLKKEGREWIEPIPNWWPFKSNLPK